MESPVSLPADTAKASPLDSTIFLERCLRTGFVDSSPADARERSRTMGQKRRFSESLDGHVPDAVLAGACAAWFAVLIRNTGEFCLTGVQVANLQTAGLL